MAQEPLEEETDDLDDGFPPPERKVVTQSYDLSVLRPLRIACLGSRLQLREKRDLSLEIVRELLHGSSIL